MPEIEHESPEPNEEKRPTEPVPVPGDVLKRVRRGKEELREITPKRELSSRFLSGEQYARISREGVYSPDMSRSTTDFAPWQERRVGNLLFDVYRREVSAALSRVPDYEIAGRQTDPEDEAGARIAERVADWGHVEWGLRKIHEDALGKAVVKAEAFAWPYFEPDAGPVVGEDEDGSPIREGGVCVHVYAGEQVMWEPGLAYERSRWWAFAQARSVDDVKNSEGYIGPEELKGNAKTSDLVNDSQAPSSGDLVVVVDYFERPSEKYQDGRWLTMVDDTLIYESADYPVYEVDPEDYEGDAPGRVTVDKPPAVRLVFSEHPDHKRGMSLFEHLIDPQRSYNNSVNRIVEWIKLTMNPQAVVLNGRLKEPLSSQPGVRYTAEGADDVKWREPGQVPNALPDMRDFSAQEIGRIAAQNDLPAGVESGKALATFVERDQMASATFRANFADFAADLMTRCLSIVACHFTTPMLVSLRGRLGWEHVKDFRGAMMRAQVNVRVDPSSIEPRTKEGQRQLIQNLIALFPGAWPKEIVAHAMQEGNIDILTEDDQRDRARINRIIERIRGGEDMLFGQDTSPDGIDPVASEQAGAEQPYAPDWMPAEYDNVGLWLYTFGSWMKTPDYESLPQNLKDVARRIYSQLLVYRQGEEQRQQMMVAQKAAGLGTANAAAPQDAQMPSLPAVDGGEAQAA